MLAPVALFVYNRPEHTLRTLEALEKNTLSKESHLIIFSDGPKSGISTAELERIEQVRKIIRSRNWCGKTDVVESRVNRGLSRSLIEGITEITNLHGKAIIVEDDILCRREFLEYSNEGLRRFERDERVMQVGAYMFPSRIALPETFFSTAIFIWGWATWKRAWEHFSHDASGQLKRIMESGDRHAFDLHGAYAYTELLRRQAEGRINTWDICWNASVFLQQGISLNPGWSLTENTGFDGSGTHWVAHGRKSSLRPESPRTITTYPEKAVVQPRSQQLLENAVFEWYHPGRLPRWKSKLRLALGMQS